MTASPHPATARPPTATAIAAMIASMFFFSVMAVLIKLVGDRTPLSFIIFSRSLFAFLVLIPVVIASGGLNVLKTRNPLGHVMRAAIGLSAMVLSFWAIVVLPLANATAIGFASPLFMTALAVPLLGERVGPRRLVAVVAGFVGILLIVKPDSGIFTTGALVALAGAVFYALAMISIRRLSRTESSVTIVFWFTCACTLATGAALPFQYHPPTWHDAALLAGIGLLGGLGQVLMTTAYRLAPVVVVGPFDYTQMVWALLFGWLIWNDLPDIPVLLGATTVVGSGIYITLHEARFGRRGTGTATDVPITGPEAK